MQAENRRLFLGGHVNSCYKTQIIFLFGGLFLNSEIRCREDAVNLLFKIRAPEADQQNRPSVLRQ